MKAPIHKRRRSIDSIQDAAERIDREIGRILEVAYGKYGKYTSVAMEKTRVRVSRA